MNMDIQTLKVGDQVARIHGWRGVPTGVDFGTVTKVTKTRVTAKFGDKERAYSMRNRPCEGAKTAGWINGNTDYLDTIEDGQAVDAALNARHAIGERIRRAQAEVATALQADPSEDGVKDMAARLLRAANILECKEIKLTLEQRTWIERQLVPACLKHARAAYTECGLPCPALGVTAGILWPSEGDEFVLVVFWTGIDDYAAEYVAAALEDDFPGIHFTVRAEW